MEFAAKAKCPTARAIVGRNEATVRTNITTALPPKLNASRRVDRDSAVNTSPLRQCQQSAPLHIWKIANSETFPLKIAVTQPLELFGRRTVGWDILLESDVSHQAATFLLTGIP